MKGINIIFHYRPVPNRSITTLPSTDGKKRPTSHLSTASCTRALDPSRACTGARAALLRRNRLVQLLVLGRGGLGRWRIPVVQDLDEEDRVERETCDEPIEDKGIGDFLEGREDTAERAEEVIDYLAAD